MTTTHEDTGAGGDAGILELRVAVLGLVEVEFLLLA